MTEAQSATSEDARIAEQGSNNSTVIYATGAAPRVTWRC